jgi:peroxiredoxin
MSRTKIVRPGSVVAPRELVTISGEAVRIPDSDQLVHLQLRRFAGCPICNVHLQSVARRHREIAAAGIREVVVFHSSDDELRRHGVELPFAVISDPTKTLYAEFGVGSSRRAILDPRALAPVVTQRVRQLAKRGSAIPTPVYNSSPIGGRLGLPGDFLIDSDGRVIAAKYGTHAYDQWSVDELLAQVH